MGVLLRDVGFKVSVRVRVRVRVRARARTRAKARVLCLHNRHVAIVSRHNTRS